MERGGFRGYIFSQILGVFIVIFFHYLLKRYIVPSPNSFLFPTALIHFKVHSEINIQSHLRMYFEMNQGGQKHEVNLVKIQIGASLNKMTVDSSMYYSTYACSQ